VGLGGVRICEAKKTTVDQGSWRNLGLRKVKVANTQSHRYGKGPKGFKGSKKTHKEREGKGFTGDVRTRKRAGWFLPFMRTDGFTPVQ
jgi:hypothetical protein